MEPLINPNEVHEIFMDCLYKEEELKNGNPTDYLPAKGLMINVGLNPTRVAKHSNRIKEILEQLPPVFAEGYSFLEIVNDKNGTLWTGMHKTADELVCLGIVTKRAEVVMREVQAVLPGGVPYILIKPEGIKKEENANTKTTPM